MFNNYYSFSRSNLRAWKCFLLWRVANGECWMVIYCSLVWLLLLSNWSAIHSYRAQCLHTNTRITSGFLQYRNEAKSEEIKKKQQICSWEEQIRKSCMRRCHSKIGLFPFSHSRLTVIFIQFRFLCILWSFLLLLVFLFLWIKKNWWNFRTRAKLPHS